jgi:tetratricopeptide (TPR) repeat protein
MTRSLFRLIVLFTLSLVALPLIAQTRAPDDVRTVRAQINGQVRFANGGAPAYNVIVEMVNFNSGGNVQVMTDRNGKFNFPNVEATQVIIIVRVAGYIEERQTVDLATSLNQYVQIALRSDGSATAPTYPPAVINPKAPGAAQREYEAGYAAVNQGEAEKGIPHLEKAVALYADFTEAYLLLGTAYMDAQQWDKAESALRRAIELNPKSIAAYFVLGEMYQQQKKYTEAEKAIRDGLKVEERSWQGHFALGRLFWEMNDIYKAGREVAKTLQLKPDMPEAHLLGGNILLRARKNEDALYEFQEYLRLDPNGRFAPQAKEMVAKIEKARAEKGK